MSHKSVHVGYITRVEGEGSVHLEIHDGKLTEARLRIFEAPRYFESLLKGRSIAEAPDITARICGICPAAYQMSAVHAVEHLAGVVIDGPLADLRRLLYCGEWIESHSVHLFMLHLPDFLGYPSLIAMARDDKDLVMRGLHVKKAGNSIIRVLGGREIHPVNVRIGGFYSIPSSTDLKSVLPDLKQATQEMYEIIEMLAGLSYPELEREYEFVALRDDFEYPMCKGRIVSSRGLNISAEEFEDAVQEFQVRGSNALYAKIRGRGAYVCGPLARLALNFDRLPLDLQDLGRRLELEGGTRNPYRSILVRALEILLALSEAKRIIENFVVPPSPSLPVPIKAGSARAATEAPRGLLYHRYDLDDAGVILAARLIPPTSQNQLAMEDDIRAILAGHLDESDAIIQGLSERAIRNHDPCISCAAHFLRVTSARHGSPVPKLIY